MSGHDQSCRDPMLHECRSEMLGAAPSGGARGVQSGKGSRQLAGSTNSSAHIQHQLHHAPATMTADFGAMQWSQHLHHAYIGIIVVGSTCRQRIALLFWVGFSGHRYLKVGMYCTHRAIGKDLIRWWRPVDGSSGNSLRRVSSWQTKKTGSDAENTEDSIVQAHS